jgi:dsRNA-specific ribonuclease
MHGTKNIGNMEQKHDYKATVKEQIQYKCGTKLQYMWNKKCRDHGMKHEYKRE